MRRSPSRKWARVLHSICTSCGSCTPRPEKRELPPRPPPASVKSVCLAEEKLSFDLGGFLQRLYIEVLSSFLYPPLTGGSGVSRYLPRSFLFFGSCARFAIRHHDASPSGRGNYFSGCTSASVGFSFRTNTLLLVSTAQKSWRLASYIMPSETFRPVLPLGSSPVSLSETQRLVFGS